MKNTREQNIKLLLKNIEDTYPELLKVKFRYSRDISQDFISYIVNEIFAITYEDVVSVHKIYFRPFKHKIYNNIKICPTHLTKAISRYHNLHLDKCLYIDIPKVDSLLEENLNPMINIVLKNIMLYKTNIYVLPVVLEDFSYTTPNIYIRFCYTKSLEGYLEHMAYRDTYTDVINDEYGKTFNCIWCHPSWLGLTLFNILKDNKYLHVHSLMKEITNDRITCKDKLDYNEMYLAIKSLLGTKDKASNTFKSITNNLWNFSKHSILLYNKNMINLEQRIWDLHIQNKLDTLTEPTVKVRPRRLKTEEEQYEMVELTDELLEKTRSYLESINL